MNQQDRVPPGTVPLVRSVYEPYHDMYDWSAAHEGDHEVNHECGLYKCQFAGFRVVDEQVFETWMCLRTESLDLLEIEYEPVDLSEIEYE